MEEVADLWKGLGGRKWNGQWSGGEIEGKEKRESGGGDRLTERTRRKKMEWAVD